MLMIPTYVIAFFITIMTVPEGTHQFTMDVKGKTIQWTQAETGWRAVELPRDDWGLHTIKGAQVTITGEGHTLKTNMSRFLSVPDDVNWRTITRLPVSMPSLGDPVGIKREDGKIILSQEKGLLFAKPVTITWSSPVKAYACFLVGDKELSEAVTLAAAFFQGYLSRSKPSPVKYRIIAAQNLLDKGDSIWRVTIKPTTLIPADPTGKKFRVSGERFVTVNLTTKQCSMEH